MCGSQHHLSHQQRHSGSCFEIIPRVRSAWRPLQGRAHDHGAIRVAGHQSARPRRDAPGLPPPTRVWIRGRAASTSPAALLRPERELHSLRALLGSLIPMHAGLLAGGLGLWRGECRCGEGHCKGQGKHGNESLHRVPPVATLLQDGSTIVPALSPSRCFPMSRWPEETPKKEGAGGFSSGPSFSGLRLGGPRDRPPLAGDERRHSCLPSCKETGGHSSQAHSTSVRNNLP
jgi:hypothetical protein